MPPPAVLIDRWGPGVDGERCRVPAADRPPPLRAPVGDPTLITPVKGTYSGEIESLD